MAIQNSFGLSIPTTGCVQLNQREAEASRQASSNSRTQTANLTSFDRLPDDCVDHVFAHFTPREVLVCTRVNRLFAGISHRVFPAMAAPNVTGEARKAIVSWTGNHAIFGAGELPENERALYPQAKVQETMSTVFSYLAAEDIYQIAQERLLEYYGRDFLQILGGAKHYASLPHFSLPGHVNGRSYIDQVGPWDLTDARGTSQSLMKTIDNHDRLALAIVFRDGENQCVRVFHQRHLYANNRLVRAGKGDGDTGLVNGLEDCAPRRIDLISSLQQMASGTHLTTVIDRASIRTTHRTHLMQRIRVQVSLALEFTRTVAFSNEGIRNLIMTYVGEFADEDIKTYQKLVKTWGYYFPSNLPSSLGGLCRVSHLPRLDAVQQDLAYCLRPDNLVTETEYLRPIMQRMRQNNTLVVQQYFPRWVFVKFADKQDPQRTCVRAFFQKEERDQEGVLVCSRLPTLCGPAAAAMARMEEFEGLLVSEEQAILPAVEELERQPADTVTATLKEMALGRHPTVTIDVEGD